MNKSLGLVALLQCFTILFNVPLFAEVRTYEVSEAKDIERILDGISCLNMILHGENTSHRVAAASLIGLYVGKLKVTDDDSAVYVWPEDNRDYRIKRSLELSFYDRSLETRMILKTKPCGAEPLIERKPIHSIWEDE